MRLLLEGVCFTYPGGVQALRGVNLRIEPGEAVAVLGENGAGKTTLAKHFNGLLRPSSGRVLVGDWDTREHTVAQLAQRVAFVFQNPDEQLFERTVRAEVAFGPRNLGCDGAEVQQRVERALAQVGLLEAADRHPYDLHPADRKRVALAAALAMQTPVVVLDEPTLGQDAAGVRLLAEVVEGLKAEGRTVVIISHDVDFCGEHLERVVVMSQGRVLADGPTGEVLAQEALLREAAIEPPQLVRLAQALGLPGTPLTAPAFVETLGAQRRERGA